MLFPQLNQTWNIVILILLILVSLYILLLITNLIFVSSFSSMMRRENKAIRVSLTAKLDILLKAKEVILANGIKITDECLHTLKYLDSEDFYEIQKDDFFKSTEDMASVEKEISIILFFNKKLADNNEVSLLQSLLKDVNESLRTLYMSYNADVLGYNYWIKFPPCGFFFRLFKTKTKRTI